MRKPGHDLPLCDGCNAHLRVVLPLWTGGTHRAVVATHFSSWHIAPFRCAAEFGRYRVWRTLQAECPGNLWVHGLIHEHSSSVLPIPLVVVLLAWLTILFVGFGMFGNLNATVLMALFVGALSVADRGQNNCPVCLDVIGTLVDSLGLARCGASLVDSLTQRIAVATSTPNRSADARREGPPSTTAHTQTQIFRQRLFDIPCWPPIQPAWRIR